MSRIEWVKPDGTPARGRPTKVAMARVAAETGMTGRAKKLFGAKPTARKPRGGKATVKTKRTGTGKVGRPKGFTCSAETRAKMSAAQRKRHGTAGKKTVKKTTGKVGRPAKAKDANAKPRVSRAAALKAKQAGYVAKRKEKKAAVKAKKIEWVKADGTPARGRPTKVAKARVAAETKKK